MSEGEHLDMTLPYPQAVLGVPRHRALDDLPVNAGISLKVVVLCPLLKVEEIGEEAEGLFLVEQLEAERRTEMGLKDGCGLL